MGRENLARFEADSSMTFSGFESRGFCEGGGIEVEVGGGALVRDDCAGMKTRGGSGEESTMVEVRLMKSKRCA